MGVSTRFNTGESMKIVEYIGKLTVNCEHGEKVTKQYLDQTLIKAQQHLKNSQGVYVVQLKSCTEFFKYDTNQIEYNIVFETAEQGVTPNPLRKPLFL